MAAVELANMREAFDACDGDADGWIAAPEFSRLLQTLDTDLSSDECLLAFEVADTDGDGAISFEEFMRWWTQ